MIPVTDKLGRKFGPGSYIAYGHALGRCAGIRIGKVLDVRADPEAPEGVKITVWGVDDDWRSRGPELCRTKGTLMFPSRIASLDGTEIPQNLYEILEPVTLDTKGRRGSL